MTGRKTASTHPIRIHHRVYIMLREFMEDYSIKSIQDAASFLLMRGLNQYEEKPSGVSGEGDS